MLLRNHQRRSLALVLAFMLCITGIPADALAEGLGEEQEVATYGELSQELTDESVEQETTKDSSAPKVLYRAHAQGKDAWASDEDGWVAATASAPSADAEASSSADKPLDSLELTIGAEEANIEYRLLDAEGAWQKKWTSAGTAATIEKGIYGLQARLSDDLETEYDLWYRSRTVGGTWLGWTHSGLSSGSANTPIADVQFALTVFGEKPTTEGADAKGSAGNTVVFEEATNKDAEGAKEDAVATKDDSTDELSAQAAESDDETAADEGANKTTEDASEEGAAATTDDEESDVAATQDDEAAAEEEADAETSAQDTNDEAALENANEEANEPTDAAPAEEDVAIDALPADGKGDGGEITAQADGPSITYQTHVQSYGWASWVSDGHMAGTSNQSKRVEAVRIELKNANGSVVYQTHVQRDGWHSEVSNGAESGTTGQSKRVEAIKIRLTGSIANTYDVWYRSHVQTYGWQGWVKNGELSGTSGQSKRVEAIEVRLVRKDGTAPTPQRTTGVEYQAHAQTYGWLDWVSNGDTAGTSGESKRLEAVRVMLQGVDGGVQYRTHVQTYGWGDWVSNGALAGTSGLSKRLEAIDISLTGQAANEYDIWYRCHIQKHGWLGWAKNGANAGSEGGSLRMEAIQVKLLPKGSAAPGSTDTPYVVVRSGTLNGVDISGWQQGMDLSDTEADFFIIKATEGVSTPGSPATRYNPWYRQWADEVLASGRLLGFYHYANGGDAIAEADDFYEAIKDYQGRAIACLDWEGQGNELFDTGMDVAWCKTFLDRLQSRFGGTPFLYTSKNYCNAYDWSPVAEQYPLWGAQYATSDPTYGYESDPWQSSNPWGAWGAKPTIFQYSGTGVLEHSGGMQYLDINLFYGDTNLWYSYL